MTHTAPRRRAWPVLLLAGALLVSGGLSGVALGAKDKPAKAEKAPVASAEPTPTPEPTPEPTPYPEFDPASVTVLTELLTDELDGAVYLADDGIRGRSGNTCLYVVEKDGQVWIVSPDDGFKARRPFLDISDRVATGPEQGLHSIAFHPTQFKTKGRFFVRYDDLKTGSAIVEEFKGSACRPAAKDAAKKGKRWVNQSQDYPNNNAGWIGFGPDGMLYVPLGDGGGPRPGDPNGYGQTTSTPLSKVLRIDVGRNDGIPRNNPYVRVARNGKLKAVGDWPRQTWAMGLRDPRRASFDRETGDFWIGDVGQDHLDQVGWEEVNLIPARSVKKGKPAPNFGWSNVEGESTCHPVNDPVCDPTLYTPPVWSYEKAAPHRAITGGYVYRGKSIPQLSGVYLFSDFSSGYVWGLDAEAIYEGFEVEAHELLQAPQGFVSFGEDDDGELYLVTLEGSIYRIGAEGR